MKLSELLQNISYRLADHSIFCDHEIKRVTTEPRRADEQALFVCTRTALRDGHDSVGVAYSAGCRAFLVERMPELPADATVGIVSDAEALLGELVARCNGYPARQMTVIGVTGTAGKSSVVQGLVALLEGAGHRVGALTTDGVRMNRSRRVAGDIVPDAAEIGELLAEFAQSGVEIAVLELSAYQLHHKAAASIPFTAVLLTNLFPAHIGFGEFRDFEEYHAAKMSLLSCGAPVIIVPTSLAIPVAGNIVTFGEKGDFRAEECVPCVDKKGFGTRLSLCFPNGEKHGISLPVPGDFAVDNALAIAALATVLSIAPAQICRGLSRIQPIGRMQCVGIAGQRYVYIDSAYEEQALTRVLSVLRARTQGRLSVLLGSVGGRAIARRAPLGRAAAACADHVYLTADDPNFEDPEHICREMMYAGDPARCTLCIDRHRAILRAILEMCPGDTLLLAGMGACQTQLIAGKREPFSETEAVAEAMGMICE